MKQFKSEFTHSYKTYSFGYCQYAQLETGDVLADVYEAGFLPFSGAPHITETLYMARGARIDLERFTENSENRRIAKKFDGTLFRTTTPITEFNYRDENFLDFCLQYFAKRHGKEALPRERLLTVLESGFPLSIITYRNNDGAIVGYAFEINDKTMGHYWFSFYDLDYAYKSLGLWIMLDCIRHAKQERKRYYYLGTIYGEKALYKTNFDALEFWDGNDWCSDKKMLKSFSRADAEHICDHIDRWKEERRKF